jgi:ABC-type lipoprotein release transport system permease subunit
MTFGRLLWRNLAYHWRGNLAVLLGVVVGAAVLTGALLVGDSLRGSLRALTLERLGGVEYALLPGRFFREELAGELGAEGIWPVLMVQGSVTAGDAGSVPVPRVVLYGVEERFWPADQVPLGRDFWQRAERVDPQNRGVVLGSALARHLGAQVGTLVTFHLPKASSAPRETVLGRRNTKEVVAAVRLKVAAILPEDHLGSKFSLAPASAAPRNAFVPLAFLQDELRGQERTLPEHPVNALLVQGGDQEELQAKLWGHLQLEDWGLVLRKPKRRGKIPAPKYLSLESRQLFLPPGVTRAVRQAGLTTAPTLVYMVNNLAAAKQQAATAAALLAPPGQVPLALPAVAYSGPLEIPYSVVAALDPGMDPPLGPFLPRGMKELADDQIMLVDYPDSPLQGVKPGEVLTLTYFQPGEEGRLHEETAAFKLAAVIPLAGAANDPNLTPQFPGITDRLTLDAWDPPFPFDKARIRPADERYWTAHRTTPKAYVTLKAGRRLWGSRFGKSTSLRIAPGGLSKEKIASEILAHLQPAAAGLVFQDVRARGLEASAGQSDFAWLFPAFSIFLIAAALLLVGLLFRLNLDRRAAEIGLLLAAGFRRRTVRWLLLLEGGLLAAAGGVVGCAGALGYAWLLLRYLSASWPGGLDRSVLQLHATAFSFVIGYIASVAVSLLTILWATRVLARIPASALLAGATVASLQEDTDRPRPGWSLWIAGACGIAAVAALVVGAVASDHEMRAGGFFGSGALLLLALIALVWAWMRGGRHGHAPGVPSLTMLGARNAARYPLRSVLTVGLLASATFLVVAVQAFHREPGRDFLARTGGSGGFALLAESEVPIYQDLSSARSRRNLGLSGPAQDALRQTVIYPLRLSPGDDVSCLNLYKPLQPRLLGVPRSLIDRGGFHFAGTLASSAEEQANPWLLLRQHQPDGALPVFGETNTVTWILKSGLGEELRVKDERGNDVKLRIVGLFQDSVFQSELVMSEESFLTVYPRQEGFQMFLIDTPAEDVPRVKAALETALASHGLAVTPSGERLASYLAVENTYLATFQALGGLGLLLGALGLAVVLLRSVWERRGELALLRAVGFRRAALAWLVLAETGCLLAVGLAVGAGAALVAVAPHLLGGVGEVLWLRLLGLLGLVLIVGLAAGAAAVATTLRAPLLPALRRE